MKVSGKIWATLGSAHPTPGIFKRNRSFSKTHYKLREFENASFSFWCGQNSRKHFENGAFRERWRRDNHVISLSEFIKHKSKMTGDFCDFLISPSYCRWKTFADFSELKPNPRARDAWNWSERSNSVWRRHLLLICKVISDWFSVCVG